MQETKFNYVVSSDDTLVSPDTGTYTSISASSNINNTTTNNHLLGGTVLISLALIFLAFIFFIVKKQRNKAKAFNDGTMDIKHKNRSSALSSIFATVLLLSGFIMLIATTMNYTTATPAPNDDFTTRRDVTTTITLDKTDSVTACATDTVTMTSALAGGYTLNFTASNIDPTISSITEYELTVDDATPTTITPNNTITIKDITTVVGAGDTTDVTLCISFPADTEPGTYTVTGVYDSTVEIYSVVWKNYDGAVLYEDNNVLRGTTPEYRGAIPAKPADAQYTYTFNGWTPEVTVATKDTTYAATYTQQAIDYTITYDLADGTLPTGSTNPTTYNVETDTFTLINPERANYTFTGWTGSNGTTPAKTITVTKGTTGNLNYVANWGDCPVNQICYDDNGANSPTTMSNQVVSENTTSVTLWASNFQYTGGGYGFAGWNTKADGTGTSYGPNEDITDETVLNKIKLEGLDLYAIWIPSAGNLQNWNDCNTMNIGGVTALTDTRDNNTYAVAKLADGKCWMIENLRFGGEEPIVLNSDSSDLATDLSFTFSASQDPTTNAWCKSNSATCFDQSMLASNNIVRTITDMTQATLGSTDGRGVYSMGNYYNWYSATAGTGTYSVVNRNTTSSICPAGWRLPTGGNIGADFAKLDIAMGGTGGRQNTVKASNRWRTYPSNYIYSGYINGSSISDRGGIGGNVWASTAGSVNSFAQHLGLYSGYVYPAVSYFNGYKSNGRSVRCISRISGL